MRAATLTGWPPNALRGPLTKVEPPLSDPRCLPLTRARKCQGRRDRGLWRDVGEQALSGGEELELAGPLRQLGGAGLGQARARARLTRRGGGGQRADIIRLARRGPGRRAHAEAPARIFKPSVEVLPPVVVVVTRGEAEDQGVVAI